jgi:hypothetical protein
MTVVETTTVDVFAGLDSAETAGESNELSFRVAISAAISGTIIALEMMWLGVLAYAAYVFIL